MIKRILKIWFTIAMYELGKWLGRELYYKLSANDEVDKAPNDYANESDQYDINGVETMTGWIVLIPIVYLIWIVVKSEEGRSDNN